MEYMAVVCRQVEVLVEQGQTLSESDESVFETLSLELTDQLQRIAEEVAQLQTRAFENQGADEFDRRDAMKDAHIAKAQSTNLRHNIWNIDNQLGPALSGAVGNCDEIFKKFDKNGDGFIRASEMDSLMDEVLAGKLSQFGASTISTVGLTFNSDKELAKVLSKLAFKAADTNLDGKVSAEELQAWFDGYAAKVSKGRKPMSGQPIGARPAA